MKNALLFVFMVSYNLLFSQNDISIFIKDSITKEPIPYSSVLINKKQYLTNDFGEITFKKDTASHNLIQVSCVGYNSFQKEFSAKLPRLEILLARSTLNLSEVDVKGFTDNALADVLMQTFKNSKKTLKNASGEIVTYSTENSTTLVEYVRSMVNLNYSNGMLNPLELKCGEIQFSLNDVTNCFKSEAISQLFLHTNPYSNPQVRYFLSPFMARKSTDLLQFYTLSYNWLSNTSLKINFESKNTLIKGSVIVLYKKMQLQEINCNWLFNSKYPLTTEGNGTFKNDMKISTKIIYSDGDFTYQTLYVNLHYNINNRTDNIEAHSYLSLINSSQYTMPLNAISFNSDYNNILSRPTNQFMRSCMLKNNSIVLDSLIKETPEIINVSNYISKQDLPNTQTEIQRLIQQITSVDFWHPDWQLDWRKISEKGTKKSDYIEVRIYADFYATADTIEYTIEPLLNYNATFFSEQRNAQSAEYLSFFFHLTKIKADELTQYLKTNYPKTIDYKLFKTTVNKFNTALRKDLFKYKLQVNGGANQAAMEYWREYIVNHIKLGEE